MKKRLDLIIDNHHVRKGRTYTAYESFDNEVDRDRRISELYLYEDKEIVCQNVDDNNMYILKYTVKQL